MLICLLPGGWKIVSALLEGPIFEAVLPGVGLQHAQGPGAEDNKQTSIPKTVCNNCHLQSVHPGSMPVFLLVRKKTVCNFVFSVLACN